MKETNAAKKDGSFFEKHAEIWKFVKFTFTTPDYLDKETAKDLKPYLKSQPVCLEWKEGKFVTREDLNPSLK